MKKLLYITGNEKKFNNAKAFLATYDIIPELKHVNIHEIQSSDAIAIAVQKARDAYSQLHKPLFVNDASWHIPALNGFPGPYMRYIVNWLNANDLLKLMEDKSDRSIFLRDTIVYKDSKIEKVFTNNVHGALLKTLPTGGNDPVMTNIITLESNGASIAESKIVGYSDKEIPLWKDFAVWLNSF